MGDSALTVPTSFVWIGPCITDFVKFSSIPAGGRNTSKMSEQKFYEYSEESQSSRLARKSEEAPFFPIAIGVCTLAVAYGAYAFKNKGKMSTSVYLMHLRVGAQGLAVLSLTGGLLYTMVNEHILKKKPSKS